MTLLLKSQLRFLRRHPVGAVASWLGITLAAVATVSVHLVSQAIRTTLDAGNHVGFSHTHVLTAPGLTEADYFDLRRRWREGELPQVQAMAPVVDTILDLGTAPAADWTAPTERADGPVRLIGFDPLAASWPAMGPGAMAIAVPTLVEPSFLLRDVVVASPSTARRLTTAGLDVEIIEGVPDSSPIVSATVLADLPTAMRLRDTEGQPGTGRADTRSAALAEDTNSAPLDAIWLTLDSAHTSFVSALDQALPGIAAALPRHGELAVPAYHVTDVRSWNPASRFADAMAFTLGALALLSMVMAGLVAMQASYSNAARRRVENERLIAIGVTATRLRALSLAEGCVLGATATAVGIALGAFVSQRLLEAAYGVGDVNVDAWVVGKAAVCALAVSILGPLVAARRSDGQRRWTHVFGAAIALLTIIALHEPTLVTAFGVLTGMCVLQIAYVVPFAVALVSRFAALTRSMATRANLRAANVRAPELRLALGALSVAVGTAIGMGLMVDSLRIDFTAMLDERMVRGLYVDADAPITPADVAWARALPGAQSVRRYADLDARLERGPARITLAVLDEFELDRYGFGGAASAKSPAASGVLLNEVGARQYGVDVGDSVTVVRRNTRQTVTVAHVFRDFGAPMPRLILPDSLAGDFESDAVRWQRLTVTGDDSALPGLATALAQRFGAANVRNDTDIRALALDVFERTFTLSRSLTMLVLVVAVVGLYAALTALEASRQREFALLGAIGVGRLGIWRLAATQTSALGVAAVAAAAPLGIAMAWQLCNVIQPLAFGWAIDFQLSFEAIAVPALVGLGSAVVAGLLGLIRQSG